MYHQDNANKPYWENGNNSNKSLRQILDDMEKEEVRMRNGYPVHCPPLRTGSGVRFGW